MKRSRLGDGEAADGEEERASSRVRRSSGTSAEDTGLLPVTTESSVTLQASGSHSEDDSEAVGPSQDDEYDDEVEEGDNEGGSDGIGESWGFVVYRTTYGDEAGWQAFRKALDGFIEAASESIKSEDADPEAVMLLFVEDEATLKNATSQQIRRIFNPKYKEPSKVEDIESDSTPPPIRDDGLCDSVCLMIDEVSMESVLNHSPKSPGYVLAVDVGSEESEQWTSKPGATDDDQELVQCEYDGTMKVHVEAFLTEFYLRSIKDGTLIMGEIHGRPDEVWSAVGEL